MRTSTICAVVFILLTVVGCVPPGPSYASAAATIPPVAPGMARVFYYRWLEPYESTTPAVTYLNGKPVGVTETGAVFYRDVAPGQYLISIQSDDSFPNQNKTVVLRPGDVAYVRIESLKSWSFCGGGGSGDGGSGGSSGCRDTFVVQIMDPYLAQGEMRDLRFIPG